jgi:hypothetical protein
VSTIPEVIARMRTIDAGLPRKDGVAIFNRLYLQVTLAVDSASAGTEFEDKRFVDCLDVVFASLYFDAEATIDSGADCPVAWRPLVETRSQAREPICADSSVEPSSTTMISAGWTVWARIESMVSTMYRALL